MLPVTDQAAVPIEEPDSAHRTSAGESILVVEDQEALRAVTERIFTRNGYHVLTAVNGPEALEFAAGHDGDIHLLVTDVVMPSHIPFGLAGSRRDRRTCSAMWIHDRSHDGEWTGARPCAHGL
jgi:response regulator RpfG family c-di-GMP phosphodiesterase